MLRSENIEQVLLELGRALARRQSKHECGQFVRAVPLPPDLVAAAAEIGALFGLPEAWLNPGPTDLLDDRLPGGYEERLETQVFDALTVHVLGRTDLIALKLLAASDPTRGQRDMADLRALAPERSELVKAARWALEVRYRGFRSDMVFLAENLGLRDAEAEL